MSISLRSDLHLSVLQRVELAVDLVTTTARTALTVAGEVGDLVPGLSIAAKLLSNIWDAVEGVDVCPTAKHCMAVIMTDLILESSQTDLPACV